MVPWSIAGQNSRDRPSDREDCFSRSMVRRRASPVLEGRGNERGTNLQHQKCLTQTPSIMSNSGLSKSATSLPFLEWFPATDPDILYPDFITVIL